MRKSARSLLTPSPQSNPEVNSALESAVGINYGLQLAASFPELNFDCGLGTGSLLNANVADLPIVSGEIEIKAFEPNFGTHEVAPDRFDWWKNRVMKTWELTA
jgi:O-succinylbenzoate synthase